MNDETAAISVLAARDQRIRAQLPAPDEPDRLDVLLFARAGLCGCGSARRHQYPAGGCPDPDRADRTDRSLLLVLESTRARRGLRIHRHGDGRPLGPLRTGPDADRDALLLLRADRAARGVR